MNVVRYDEAHRLAAGRVELGRGKVQKAQEKLAAHDRELATCTQDRLRLEGEIREVHRDGSGRKRLDALREKLNKVLLREQSYLAERNYVERLLREAEEGLAAAIVDAHTANRRRLQQEGIKLAAEIRGNLRDTEELVGKLEQIREQERMAKDASRDSPQSREMPTFDYLTLIDGWDRDLLRQIFDRVHRAEEELEHRSQGRPGGNLPGVYSMSQQRR